MDLSRFIEAHQVNYKCALQEIKNGKKLTHWMWYIFPQIIGLGRSSTAKYYAIQSLEEGFFYYNNYLLREHLIEISTALLELKTNNPLEVFGGVDCLRPVDALKLNSSMTLFYYISNNDLFKQVIDKYFNGEQDLKTLEICESMAQEHNFSL